MAHRAGVADQGIRLENGAYRVRVFFQGRHHSGGSFPTHDEAVAARDRLLAQLQDAPKITGVTPEPVATNVEERALDEWRTISTLAERRAHQQIEFGCNHVALVCIGDLHIGGDGVDYPRLLADCDLIARTPGMYVVLTGDLVDNFVKPKLLGLRMGTRLTIPDEVEMLRKVLAKIADKIVAAVAGNHELWTGQLVGIDYLREVLNQINPQMLYDSYDCRFLARIPSGREWAVRVRHRWAGGSIYNPTHGIERTRLMDGWFDVGIGAHTHVGGLARSFPAEGKTCLAALCGTYKTLDVYARQLGARPTTEDAAVAVMLSRDLHGLLGISGLADAARMLEALRQ